MNAKNGKNMEAYPLWNKSTLKNLYNSTENSIVACKSPITLQRIARIARQLWRIMDNRWPKRDGESDGVTEWECWVLLKRCWVYCWCCGLWCLLAQWTSIIVLDVVAVVGFSLFQLLCAIVTEGTTIIVIIVFLVVAAAAAAIIIVMLMMMMMQIVLIVVFMMSSNQTIQLNR